MAEAREESVAPLYPAAASLERDEICILWNGQAAVHSGSEAECLAVATREGLLEWNDYEQLFVLRDGADIQCYAPFRVLRWFSADDVKLSAPTGSTSAADTKDASDKSQRSNNE